MKNSLWKIFSGLLEKKTEDFPLILTRVHFTRNSHGNFFYREIPLLFSQLRNLKLYFIPIKKLFHQNSKIAHIYISWTLCVPSFSKIREPFFFTWKSFVKFSQLSNLKLNSHKKVVSPKLENCAHLLILSFKCSKLQRI